MYILNKKEVIIILEKIIKKEKNNFDFFKGTINNKDKIAPAYINLQNPKYIEIDNLIYNHLEEEISIDSVLDIIKKITINKTEPKKLVKEIQN